MRKIATNKKAFHDFEMLATFEAGIALEGSEVKSVRAGKVNLKDSYAKVVRGELWIFNLHITPYEKATTFIPDSRRKRKLLMHKKEIFRLKSKVEEKGLTLVPTEIYINEFGIVKITLALAKGKKEYQKKDYLLEKQNIREKERELREVLKYK